MCEKTIIYLFGGTKLAFDSDDQKLDLFKQLLADCHIWDYNRAEWNGNGCIIAIDKIKSE